MKLTKEQIDQIKQDPFYKLLVAITGDENALDEAINKMDEEEGDKCVEDKPNFPLDADTVDKIKTVTKKYRDFMEAGGFGMFSVPINFFFLFREVLSLVIGEEPAYYLTAGALDEDNLNKVLNTLNVYWNE